MRITNFQLIPTTKKNVLIAEVDIKTGILWWQKTKRVKIAKLDKCDYWFSCKTGVVLVTADVDEAIRVWKVA